MNRSSLPDFLGKIFIKLDHTRSGNSFIVARQFSPMLGLYVSHHKPHRHIETSKMSGIKKACRPTMLD
jgi:hypothetical protein